MRARTRCVVWLALAAVAAACAPTRHTLEPYRSDPAAAASLESRAEAICEQGFAGPRTPPETRFVSDGCSLWLDDGWGEPCCVEHDIRYWCGGSAQERRAADASLRACVDANEPEWIAEMMWLGVRVGGHPIFPTHYRWGYGRPYRPGYEAGSAPTPEP